MILMLCRCIIKSHALQFCHNVNSKMNGHPTLHHRHPEQSPIVLLSWKVDCKLSCHPIKSILALLARRAYLLWACRLAGPATGALLATSAGSQTAFYAATTPALAPMINFISLTESLRIPQRLRARESSHITTAVPAKLVHSIM